MAGHQSKRIALVAMIGTAWNPTTRVMTHVTTTLGYGLGLWPFPVVVVVLDGGYPQFVVEPCCTCCCRLVGWNRLEWVGCSICGCVGTGVSGRMKIRPPFHKESLTGNNNNLNCDECRVSFFCRYSTGMRMTLTTDQVQGALRRLGPWYNVFEISSSIHDGLLPACFTLCNIK